MKQQFIRLNGKQIETQLDIFILKQENFFVAFSPALNLSAYGDEIEDALDSFEYTIAEFFKDMGSNQNLDAELEELGWQKYDHNFQRNILVDDFIKAIPVNIIAQKSQSYHVAVA